MPSVNVEILHFDQLDKNARKQAIENHRNDSDAESLVYGGDIFTEPYTQAGIATDIRTPIYFRLFVQGSYAYPNVVAVDVKKLLHAAGIDGRSGAARELAEAGLELQVDPRYGFHAKLVPADDSHDYGKVDEEEIDALLDSLNAYFTKLNRKTEQDLVEASLNQISDEYVAELLSNSDEWFLADGSDAPDSIVDQLD